MGIRITSNIFLGRERQNNSGSGIRDYKRFDYQVMLLFSQRTHAHLSAELYADDANGFGALDAYTGKNVVFFTCQTAKMHSAGWEYVHQPEADDRVLISEIAEFFDVDKAELPAVVVARNLWRREAVILPNIGSMAVIGPLLRHLTDLAKNKHFFSNRRLAAHLSSAFPSLRLKEPNREAGDYVGRFFDEWSSVTQRLSRGHSGVRQAGPSDKLMGLLGSAHHIDPDDEVMWQQTLSELVQELSLFAVPSMIQPSTQEPSWLKRLDQVTQSKILSVLHAQNQIQSGILRGETVIQDWSGFLVGLWGGVERMLNLSLIQLARQTRGIEMPEYFGRYHPSFDKQQSTLLIRNQKVNVNGHFKNSALGGELAMFMLGKGRELCEHLWMAETETAFQRYVQSVGEKHGLTPSVFFERLKEINHARNKGCHGQIIDATMYKTQCERMLDDSLFPMMLDIRDAVKPVVETQSQMTVELPPLPEARDGRREPLNLSPPPSTSSIEVGKDFPFPVFSALSLTPQQQRVRPAVRTDKRTDRQMRRFQNRGLIKDYLSTPGEMHPRVETLFGTRLMGLRTHPMDSLQKALISCQSEADIDSTFQELALRLNRHARSILEIIDILGRERTKTKLAELLAEETAPEADKS